MMRLVISYLPGSLRCVFATPDVLRSALERRRDRPARASIDSGSARFSDRLSTGSEAALRARFAGHPSAPFPRCRARAPDLPFAFVRLAVVRRWALDLSPSLHGLCTDLPPTFHRPSTDSRTSHAPSRCVRSASIRFDPLQSASNPSPRASICRDSALAEFRPNSARISSLPVLPITRLAGVNRWLRDAARTGSHASNSPFFRTF